VASVIYAGRGARNHRGVHSIRLIHDYRNQDGNSWGSQEASPKRRRLLLWQSYLSDAVRPAT